MKSENLVIAKRIESAYFMLRFQSFVYRHNMACEFFFILKHNRPYRPSYVGYKKRRTND